MTIPAPASAFAGGLVLQGRYRLDTPLATGGMAEVWQGHDEVLQRPVAVKLLHPHLASDPALVERFRREAIAAARLSHPNIVPTYDTGTDNGVTYIVLGLVHGPNLAELLQEQTIEPRVAVLIARQVADALEHAHQAGIVHRDVKPANVMIVGDDFRVMVGDFGIAKAVAESSDESLTMPGLVIGTPAYLAPEQASGVAADARSDVYATGVLLHEMVVGHPTIDEPTQMVAASDGDPQPRLSDQPPKGIDEVVARATEHDPEKRYQDAASMAAELAILERSYAANERGSAPQRLTLSVPKSPRPTGQLDSDNSQATAEHPVIAPSGQRHAGPPTVVQAARPQPPFDDAPYYEPAPVRGKSRRRKTITIVIAAILIVLAVALGRGISILADEGNANGQTAPATTSAPLSISSVSAFDPPPGDGTENNATLPNIIDNNPATVWSTSTYNGPNFGNLKTGVGFVLSLNGTATLKSLQLTTQSVNWDVEIYVSNSKPTTLAGWGPVVEKQTGLGTTANLDLHNAQGANVLVWFTKTGTDNRVTVADARINAA